MKNVKLIKGVAIAVATLVTITGGTSALGATMSFTQKEEQVNEIIESVNEEETTDIQNLLDNRETETLDNIETDNNIEADNNIEIDNNIETDNKEEVILNEETTKIDEINKEEVEEDCINYTINWNGKDVMVIEDSTSAQDGDLSHEEALNKASEIIKEMYNVDVTNAFPSIHLSYEAPEEQYGLKGTRVYSVFFNLKEGGMGDEYIVKVDAVTGEIYFYSYWKAETPGVKDYIENNVIVDGFEIDEFGFEKEEYDKYCNEFEKLYELNISDVEAEYNAIAEARIYEVSKMEINIVYNWFVHQNVVRTSATGVRPAIKLSCITIYGDIINFTIDQVDKTIIEWEFIGTASWVGR